MANVELLDGLGARNRIAQFARESTEGRFAVAFWGAGAGVDLGITLMGARAKVICNLATGGTNPQAIRQLMDAGVQVRQRDDLHAKVYLFPDGAVLGSSNASSNGLSMQGGECSGWTEANLLTAEPCVLGELGTWFDQHWEAAREVTEDDLAAAWNAWSRRRRHVPRPPVFKDEDLLAMLARNPDAFDGDRLYLVVYSSNMDQDGRDAVAAAQERRGMGAELDGFQDWDSLPDDADLLSIYWGPRGGFRCDGYWAMPPIRDEVPAGDGAVQLAHRIAANAYPPPGGRDRWLQVLQRLQDSAHWDGEDGSAVIEIGDFAREILMPMIAEGG